MTPERWTLLFLKNKGCPSRQYSFTSRTAYLAVGAFVAVVTSLSGLTLAVGFGGTARLQAYHLQKQNAELSATLERMKARVQGLELTLGDLANRDAELRLMAGLDAIEKDVLQVGVGGPGLSTPESHPLYALDEDLGKSAFAVTYDLNALERRARLLSESLMEAGSALERQHDLLASMPSILPTEGLLTSRFSASRLHPVHNRPLPHEGIDISAPHGTPIFAAAKGRVVEAGTFAGYGQMVEIDHGYGLTTRYGHASRLLARVGQQVERGDVIALVGRTGIATGPHLHYEVRVDGRPQNPLNYVLPDVVP